MSRPRKICSAHHAAGRAHVKFAPLITRQAFTLVELLVVIAIIGLLSTVAVIALAPAGIAARNVKRKADLVQIAKALNLYYEQNGSYPSTSGTWWGTNSKFGNHLTSGANGWVPNLAPTFMAVLPRDVNTDKANRNSAYAACYTATDNSLYLYRSNGTDYKLLANCTPEGTMSASDPFYDPRRPNWAWRLTNNPAVTDHLTTGW